MPNTQRGKLAKQTESHLQDGSYWQQNTSTSSRRTTRPSDPDLTDASEEESRRHNERVDAEDLARANKRQLQEGSSSKDRKREQKRARRSGQTSQTSHLAQEINALRKTVEAVLQSKTPAEAAAFLPKQAAAFLPTQPKPDEDKILAKKTAHTLRVKETQSQREVREKKRCQGIAKAWTFSMWMWEGSPPPPAAPAVVLMLISNSVRTNINT